jgi:hypothetical protein
MISQRLIVSAIILILFTFSLILSASFNSASDQWHGTGNRVPTKLMLRIKQENLHPEIPVDVERMRIWKIQKPEQSHPLYVVDSRITDLAKYPRVNPLCGASGCAFFIYEQTEHQDFQRIWSNYLNVNLPPTIALFALEKDFSKGLPVLTINQMEGKRIRQSHISFNGNVYEVTQTNLLPQIYE